MRRLPQYGQACVWLAVWYAQANALVVTVNAQPAAAAAAAAYAEQVMLGAKP